MAPPSPRRPGFSRRAQYGLFAGYVVAVGGALLALLLLVTAHFDPKGHSAIQGFLADLFSPISLAGRETLRSAESAGGEVGAYFRAASKNKAMAAELAAARRKLIQGQVDATENLRLKRLLGLVEQEKGPRIVSQLVSSTGASSRRYATLGAGAAQGVDVGQPVIGPDGLVGRVVQTGRVTSRVLLITDSGSIVPVKRASDGVPALANGTGTGLLDLRPLSGTTTPFQRGDVFVTSGTGGVYRPGVPVAIALRNGREATAARPLADPAALDFAIVTPRYVPEPPPAPSDVPPAP